MEIIESTLSGCYVIKPFMQNDDRGIFVKTFNCEDFKKENLETNFSEEYYSWSKKNVVRGMHFQMPPLDHVKLVSCLSGKVLDVVVDLRKNSKTYKEIFYLELSGDSKEVLYIPRGMAHGFCSLSDESLMYYKVSTVYSPDHDSGILWNSIGLDWPVEKAILSERDRGFTTLQDFKSPF